MSKKPKEIKTAQKQFTLSNLWIKLLLVGFTFVLYGNSISHQFTLDDDVFFTNHSSVQKGIKGIPELFTHGSLEKFDGAKGLQPYRPITLLSFALEIDNSGQERALNMLWAIAIGFCANIFYFKKATRTINQAKGMQTFAHKK